MDWLDLARCRGEDPELFHPVGTTGPAAAQIEQAKKVCGQCPVIDECYARSVTGNLEFGIWAGLTEDERRAGMKPKPPFRLALVNANKTHCPQAHQYTAENTHIDRRNRRHCRACARDRIAQRRLREAVAADAR